MRTRGSTQMACVASRSGLQPIRGLGTLTVSAHLIVGRGLVHHGNQRQTPVRRRKRRAIGLCGTLRRKTWTYATHHQSPAYDGCALCSQYILLSIWQCIVYACSCTFESMNCMYRRSCSARALRMSNTWPCSIGLRASLTRSTDAATRLRCSVALRRASSARATRPMRLLCLRRRCAA